MNLVGHVARIVTKSLSHTLFEYLKQWDQLRDKDISGNTKVQGICSVQKWLKSIC